MSIGYRHAHGAYGISLAAAVFFSSGQPKPCRASKAPRPTGPQCHARLDIASRSDALSPIPTLWFSFSTASTINCIRPSFSRERGRVLQSRSIRVYQGAIVSRITISASSFLDSSVLARTSATRRKWLMPKVSRTAVEETGRKSTG
ncbi:hypothetical protein K402DRAFT_388800 [Aulographum hederae CBS 113979]|uniref:Uncharacterized protein n=1 Tax=Aulographum hederae CBS 113979 TaxID=1176131 RepID=A0A6G1HDU0_9PEZI|nr:hypothetical protein K402DRAFT_388800 [Aulographum hederae CBS 113979]